MDVNGGSPDSGENAKLALAGITIAAKFTTAVGLLTKFIVIVKATDSPLYNRRRLR